MYRKALALRRHEPGLRSDGLSWIDGLGDDLVAFRRGEIAVILNPTDSAKPLASHIVGHRTVRMSSSDGHDDPALVPADTTVWLA